MEQLHRWRTRDEETEGLLRLWSFGRAGRWLYVLTVALGSALVLTSAEDDARLVAVLFTVACLLASYRFAWSRVDVTTEVITYVGVLRTRRFVWSQIEGFFTGGDGITVVDNAGQSTWLLPTKREALMPARRRAAKGEALLARVIRYAPDPSVYEPLADNG